jgi:hypothetical protein
VGAPANHCGAAPHGVEGEPARRAARCSGRASPRRALLRPQRQASHRGPCRGLVALEIGRGRVVAVTAHRAERAVSGLRALKAGRGHASGKTTMRGARALADVVVGRSCGRRPRSRRTWPWGKVVREPTDHSVAAWAQERRR